MSRLWMTSPFLVTMGIKVISSYSISIRRFPVETVIDLNCVLP